MRVYFELRKLELDEFVVNTIINTFTQYMEKRQFNIYVGNLAFSEQKKGYWNIKVDQLGKTKKDKQIKDKDYRQRLEADHDNILKDFISALPQGGE